MVYCEEVKGKVPAYFGQCPGDIHTKILERMRQVLCEETQYPYLMKNAAAPQARLYGAQRGVGREPLLRLGGDMWVLLPWLGTYPFWRWSASRCAPLGNPGAGFLAPVLHPVHDAGRPRDLFPRAGRGGGETA